MSNPYREDVLIVKLREGLYEAIQQAPEIDVRDLDSITFQKLLLKSIDYFDLREDITIQWYLDGEFIGKNQAKIDKLGEKGRLNRINEFHLSQTPSVDQIADFYLSMTEPSFSEFVHNSTFEYLREYYQENKEIPYRELYLKNLDIDGALSSIRDSIKYDGDISEDHKTVSHHCQEFKLELLIHEEFSNIMPYQRVFEQTAVSIARWAVENEDVSKEKRVSLMTHCDEFYYEGLWRGIACIISRNNVHGPSENQVEKRRLGELSAQREVFENRYRTLREEAKEIGLELNTISKDLPDLAENESIKNTWLEKHTISPNIDTQDLPTEQAATTSTDELLLGKDTGQPLSDMIIEERRN